MVVHLTFSEIYYGSKILPPDAALESFVTPFCRCSCGGMMLLKLCMLSELLSSAPAMCRFILLFTFLPYWANNRQNKITKDLFISVFTV